MDIHLPAILMFTRGTWFWPIPMFQDQKWPTTCWCPPSQAVTFPWIGSTGVRSSGCACRCRYPSADGMVWIKSSTPSRSTGHVPFVSRHEAVSGLLLAHRTRSLSPHLNWCEKLIWSSVPDGLSLLKPSLFENCWVKTWDSTRSVLARDPQKPSTHVFGALLGVLRVGFLGENTPKIPSTGAAGFRSTEPPSTYSLWWKSVSHSRKSCRCISGSDSSPPSKRILRDLIRDPKNGHWNEKKND